MQARHLRFLGVALAFVSDWVCSGIIAMEIGDLSGFLINWFGIVQGLCLLGYSMSEPEFEARYLFFGAILLSCFGPRC
ncbi:hypothetical protein C8F04DRAFT_736191 [Mycena alexandri]|uniref:Uncharacterized protein n=1 Tax=Mycena alexandri TaxID=1745969 RepID=A0AAD6X0D4_9AGAR|nr:hypothetical protein C8F04DRAFT_736191 [Mycena alexandri]